MSAPGRPSRVEVLQLDTSTLVVTVVGDADLEIAPELRSRLETAMTGGTSTIVLDLSRAALIDSTTLGVLMRAAKRMRGQSHELRIVVPQPALRRIFELTLLDRMVALHATTDEALAASAASRVREGNGDRRARLERLGG